MTLKVEILDNLRAEWDLHADTCESPPKAFLLNPGNYELLGWDEALGVPLLPDDRVEPLRCRLLCGVGVGGSCPEGDVVWDEAGNPYVVEAAEQAES